MERGEEQGEKEEEEEEEGGEEKGKWNLEGVSMQSIRTPSFV